MASRWIVGSLALLVAACQATNPAVPDAATLAKVRLWAEAPVTAQSPPPILSMPEADQAFRAIDTNDDLIVSHAEWQAANPGAARLHVLDVDENGHLTHSEWMAMVSGYLLPQSSSDPAVLAGKDFDRIVSESDVPVAVMFWAPWCGPCRLLHVLPTWSDAAYRGRLWTVNVDQAGGLADRFGITSVPVTIVFQGRIEKDRIKGAMPASRLVEFLSANGIAPL